MLTPEQEVTNKNIPKTIKLFILNIPGRPYIKIESVYSNKGADFIKEMMREKYWS
jgi:hypothetical protein